MAEIKRPRPFSLAVGVVFVIAGLAAVADTWAGLDAGAVAAIALLVAGLTALTALATRRAPRTELGSE